MSDSLDKAAPGRRGLEQELSRINNQLTVAVINVVRSTRLVADGETRWALVQALRALRDTTNDILDGATS